MANKFNEMQSKHLVLMSKYEVNKYSEELLNDVREYIELVRVTSKMINDSKERNQLEKILQFWAIFIFDKTGSYPETKLLPRDISFIVKPILIGVIIVGFLSLVTWYSNRAIIPLLDPNAQTQVVGSLTSAAYTPTPMFTPAPAEKVIVEKINEVLRQPGDGLSITIGASYIVNRAVFITDNKDLVLFIEVRCQCALNGSCCSLENSFIMVTNAMKANDVNIIVWMPLELNEVRVVCYDQSTLLGTMSVSWSDMQNYMFDTINGYQLGGAVKKIPVKKP